MKMKLLAVLGLVGLTGCSSVVAPLASDYTASTGDIVRIAYANPEKTSNCIVKGHSAFNPNSQSVLGVVSLGPDDMETDKLINSTFGDEAAAAGANYVNRGFAGSSTFGGVYERSSTVEATFFHCETVPEL
ncbi:hypothetical protein KP803_20390 [Vibrio sp. ZSDE26]|uniref:DUF4156 domain-containing protein n=1 Tax=Vibrio amylolyticus TaxID=2847292 RepID=A0A9X1XMP9_9VIBR|nr:hypothetical protein [Vibrio amylolyticus]MCK6265619.1 hypothetical protein [Vibrio amylolyticus]